MTFKVAVIAPPRAGDTPVLNQCLDHLHAQKPITELWHMGSGPSSRRLLEWAQHNAIPAKVFKYAVPDGYSEQQTARVAAVDAHPDYVVYVPCTGLAKAIVEFLRVAGAPVWEVK